MALSFPYKLNVKENHGTSEVLLFDNGDSSDATEFGRYDYQVIMPTILDLGIAVTVDNLAISTISKVFGFSSTNFFVY